MSDGRRRIRDFQAPAEMQLRALETPSLHRERAPYQSEILRHETYRRPRWEGGNSGGPELDRPAAVARL
jgi:hypothetical protein